MKTKVELKKYKLVWAPSAQEIATVLASSPAKARALAPMPWRKFRGEIYAVE